VSKGFDDGNAASLVGFDGFDDSWMGRGFNVATFDATTHAPLEQRTFDILQGTTESTNMLSFLKSVPAGDIVTILAMDAINHWSANYLSTSLKTYMATGMLATEFSSLTNFRDSYGFIGYKGSSPVAEDAKAAGTGFVTVSAIFSCNPIPPVPSPTQAPPVTAPTRLPSMPKPPTPPPPPVSAEWQPVVQFNVKDATQERVGSSFVFNGELCLIGGHFAQTIDCFNPTTKTWSHSTVTTPDIHHIDPVVYNNEVEFM